MKFLIKLILPTLISLTSLNAGYFDDKSIQFFRDALTRSFSPDGSEKFNGQFLDSSYVKVGNDIYSYGQTEIIAFNTGLKSETGFYFRKFGQEFKELYHFDRSNETIDMSCQGSLCLNNNSHEIYPNSYKKVTFSIYKKYSISKITTCQPNEHFNTETKQCQSCPEGYSWNPATNSCYKDCTDLNKNMWGLADGKCIDCSIEKRDVDVARCYCKYYGSDYDNEGFTGTPVPDGGNVSFYWWAGSCKNGMKYKFKSPETPDTPDAPDNPNPDPNNPGGGNGNNGGGNGNNGGGNGNGKDGDGKDDQYCKKNPNDPICKSGPGGGGGGNIGNGKDGDKDKDKEPKFNEKDFDYSDIEKDAEGFKDGVLNHHKDMYSRFDNFRSGYDQLMDNIKGKGLNTFKSKGIVNSCPKSFKVDFGSYGSKTVNIDICKEFSKLKGAFYHIFYLFFFVYFLFLTMAFRPDSSGFRAHVAQW